LLAHLWEFPNVPGKLNPHEAATQLSAWLGKAKESVPPPIMPLPSSTHQFTHIEWRMTNYRVELPASLPQFHWVTPAELEDTYTVPTAFRALRKLCI